MFQKTNWYVVIQKGIDSPVPIHCDTGDIRYWRTQIGALIGAYRHVKNGDGTFTMRDVKVRRNLGIKLRVIDLNELRD